jgi:hypothetical protein
LRRLQDIGALARPLEEEEKQRFDMIAHLILSDMGRVEFTAPEDNYTQKLDSGMEASYPVEQVSPAANVKIKRFSPPSDTKSATCGQPYSELDRSRQEIRLFRLEPREKELISKAVLELFIC